MSDQSASGGPGAFVRRYTRSWVHAVATAALTGFGMLTFVHRAFAVVAVAAYLIPPVALYATGHRLGDRAGNGATDTDRDRPAERTVTDAPERADDPTHEPANRTPAEDDAERTATVESDTEPRNDTEPKSEADAGTDATAGNGSDDDAPDSPAWRRATTPTDASLHDAAVADGNAYAVGADGVVLAGDGEESDDDWRVLLDDGPGAGERTLRGVAATDDGEAVWVAGDGGALARVESESGRHVDYSAPQDRTDNWTALAVGGAAGAETVLLADGGGGVMRGRYRDGDLAWADPVTPGGGSSVADATLDGERGYVCDTNDGVFETTDGGASFDPLAFDADGTPTAVAAAGTVRVADSAGVVHRHDPDSGTWTPGRVADDALSGLDALGDGDGNGDEDDGEQWVACGDALFVGDGTDWERADVPTTGTLAATAVGPGRALAVGADGLVVERR